jgi:signal peptidase I
MTSSRKKESDTEAAKTTGKGKGQAKPQEGVRETIEAVAIAFILAFVFKTFEAEAFVIPTGSMAPTLYGRHKEVTCEGCKLHYTIGASQEIDQESGILNPGARLTNSVCPNCRHVNEVFNAPVFNGDRIVVNKQVSNYRRFDVVVFKNPEEPHVNYIKRLVGLPGETVRIRQGDIQARRSESESWQVQRKDDPNKQRDIQLLVYDDQHPPEMLLKAGAEERWAPANWDQSASTMGGWPRTQNAWTPSPETRTYAVDATDDQLHWLRYRNLIPTREHWASAEASGTMEPSLEPQLIADFCGFNSDNGYEDELYWVNDLTLDCTVQIDSTTETSQLLIELVEGFRTVRCQINPTTGMADLIVISREGGRTDAEPEVLTSVQTGIQGAGEYNICFADVDDRLCLWVDDDLIPLGEKATFGPSGLNLPTDLDLAPIGIAATGMKATVSGLVIRRDIYYRNDVLNFEQQDGISPDPASYEYRNQYRNGSITVTEVDSSRYSRLATNLRSPQNYASDYATLIEEQETRYGKRLEFELAGDEYLMFGDNSPASKDSRLFDYHSRPLRGVHSHRYAVKEQDLIGEALCIFWPHGIPFLNDGKGFSLISHKKFEGNGRVSQEKDYPLYSVPFYPNISRMKVIR